MIQPIINVVLIAVGYCLCHPVTRLAACLGLAYVAWKVVT